MNAIHNPNCDGDHCTLNDGPVRVLPYGGSGGNGILCRSCFDHEMAWRRERNQELEQFAQFDLPLWSTLKVYGADSATDSVDATDSLLMVLDNDSVAYAACRGLAETAFNGAEELAAASFDVFTAEDAPRYWLSERIKEHIEAICDDAGAGLNEPASLIVAQLFRHAFEQVNWDEVAQHYLAKHIENAR